MSRDTRVKWLIILVMLATNTWLVWTLGLHFPPADLIRPLGFTLLLAAFGFYYHRRQVPSFVLCCLTLTHLVLFSTNYTILMYIGATFNLPLIDEQLSAADALLGVHVPGIVAWAQAHPVGQSLLQFAYDTLLPQTALVVMILGLWNRRRALQEFLMRFMVSGLLTWILFVFLPAEGPFTAYDYEPDQAQQRYLEHFRQLRSGERTTVTYRNAEGLITFPSFHTTWAILMALAFWKQRILFGVAALLNMAVIAATLTTGWHYFSDLLAGLLVALLAIWLTHRTRKWFYPPATEHAGAAG